MLLKALHQSLRYGWRQLCSRRLFFVGCTLVPILFTLFFLDLMREGLPLKVPVSVVDLDRSSLSRKVIRNLNATELIEVAHDDESYADALARVRKGETFGFFILPREFERDALDGSATTITFYSDMSVFVPGTLAFKGFKTTAVTTAGGIVAVTLTSMGIDEDMTGALLQPVNFNNQLIGNPWTNYSVYLSNSFVPGVLSLMVMLLACYTMLVEVRQGTSRQWLAASRGSILLAVLGKLLPQALVFTVVGVFLQSLLWGWCGFPLNCPVWHMLLAMLLLVLGSQGYAVLITCAIPNLRLALSLCSLSGILAFSIAAYSFPVQSMYGGVAIFSYILPTRYYFLIYSDQALNGMPLYYSRWFYIALIVMTFAPMALLYRLKRHCLNPVYVP